MPGKNKRTSVRSTANRLAAALSLLAAGVFAPGPRLLSAAAAKKVAVVLSNENKVYQEIERGIRERPGLDITKFDLEKNSSIAKKEIEKMNPDAVIAVGDAAARWAKSSLSKKRIIFSGVLFQTSGELVGNLPGIYLDAAPQAYIAKTKKFLPSIKKIGVLYSPERRSDFIGRLKKAAENSGLEINAQPIHAEKDVSKALNALKDWGVQGFLLTYDPLIMNYQAWQYLVGYSINNRVALIVPSKSFLKTGGLLALESSFEEIGRRSADLVDETAAQKNSEFVPDPKVGINLKLVNLLGLHTPDMKDHPEVEKISD